MLGKKRSASVFTPAAPASPVPNLEEKHTEKAVEAIAAPAALTAIPSEEAPPAEGKPVLTGRAHSLFFTPEDDSREFPDVCREVQGYIAANYSTLMTGESDSREQIKRYAAKYVQDKRIAVKGMVDRSGIAGLRGTGCSDRGTIRQQVRRRSRAGNAVVF